MVDTVISGGVTMNRFIKTISLALVIAIILSVTACSKTIPDVETVSRYSLEELDNFAKTVDEQTLIKNWGEPKIANNERLWPVDLTGETKYMVAYIEDGKIISIYESEMMFINVVLDNGGIKYCTYGWSDYSSDPYSIAFMPTKDIFGNEITCEVGDQILLETDGRVMETYPAQIPLPYAYKVMGHLSAEEIQEIAGKIRLP